MLSRCILAAGLLWLGIAPESSASSPNDLPPRLAQTVEKVSLHYFRGNSDEVVKVLSAAVSRLKDHEVARLDEALAAQEIPSTSELLVDARLKLVQQNLTSALRPPNPRERVLTLQGLRDRIHGILDSEEQQRLLDANASKPQTLKEFEERLWAIHVMQNRLLTVARSARYGVELAKGVSLGTRRRLTEQDRESIGSISADLVSSVGRRQREMKELEMEVRLQRLAHSVSVLQQPDSTKERFLAAYAAGFDARILKNFLEPQSRAAESRGRARRTSGPDLDTDETREPTAKFLREALNRPGLKDEIEQQARQAEESAGDLVQKTENFFHGLHWWMRGRYGAGPELGGLAKSAVALQHPQALVWLFMPAETPAPTPLAASAGGTNRMPVPAVDRRHHYTWAWEDRRLQHSVLEPLGSGGVSARQNFELSTFW